MGIKALVASSAIAVCMTATAGIAATVHTSFDFTGPNNSSLGDTTFTSGSGLSVDVSASRERGSDGKLKPGTAVLGQYGGGLGVCSSVGFNQGSSDCGYKRVKDYYSYYKQKWIYKTVSADDHQVDGNNPDEVVLFDFGDTDVTLKSVTLSFIGYNDQFSFSFFGDPDSATPTNFYPSVDPSGSGTVTYTFNQTWTGSMFGIGATGHNDEFKIRSLHVKYDDDQNQPDPVPLPAGGVLLLTGLGALAMRRRASKG